MNTEPYKSRLYGRKLTRPLGNDRQAILDTLMPKIGIPATQANGTRAITPADLFTFPYKSCWLEIGFGGGEHVAALMRRHQDTAFIASEPFINGMGNFLKEIQNDPHHNIRIWMEDAILLVESLADHCLDGIYVLNPDPWPKKRHRRRRVISQENLTRFARVLKPGAQLIMATDMDNLASWMVTQASNHEAFEWTAESQADWRTMPADWIPTRYEKKGAALGRQQSYLLFRKR